MVVMGGWSRNKQERGNGTIFDIEITEIIRIKFNLEVGSASTWQPKCMSVPCNECCLVRAMGYGH